MMAIAPNLGPQNLFVIRQGLAKEYLLLTALACTLCDVILCSLGVFGVGMLVAENRLLQLALGLGGVLFLMVYGFRSLWSAWVATEVTLQGSSHKGSVLSVVGLAMAFSFLNPVTFLEAVVILGGASMPYTLLQEKIMFVAGVSLVSLIWFVSLVSVASWFVQWAQKIWFVRALDIFSGLVMWGFAFVLADNLYRLMME